MERGEFVDSLQHLGGGVVNIIGGLAVLALCIGLFGLLLAWVHHALDKLDRALRK